MGSFLNLKTVAHSSAESHRSPEKKQSRRDREGDVICPYCHNWNFRVKKGMHQCQRGECQKEFEVF